uniref:non-specific serine/threonine protein kinase n=1 Tax=Streptomyces sp. A7248 TaxID=1233308 RepID=K9M8F9_9ACTN|nr:SiaQ [Streptomyces sp. A7248]
MGEGADKDSGRYTAMEGIRPLSAGDPARIGPYPLLGRLGAGGMGRVYLARSAGGRTVAVKVVHEEHIANGEFRARFRREIEAARRVGGRYTAPVLDADADADQPWVATGYVPGPSLEQAVREHGPLPADSVNALAEGLLRALRGSHAAGIVHRDLKPSNVLLTVDGPRVIDFGIARALQVSVESLLTSTGMVIGSPGFMAPEQILGEETGPGADVFSLGCVLMYAATGRLPFGAGVSNQHAVMFRIVQSPPDLAAVTDAPLRELIERCLTKSAEDRPGVDALLEGLSPSPSSAAPHGAWLPPLLLARLAQQSALLLDAEVPEVAEDREAAEAAEGPGEPDVPEADDVPAGAEPVATPAAPAASDPLPRDLGTVDLRPTPGKGDAPDPAPEPAPALTSAPGGGRTRRRRRTWIIAAVVVAVLAAGGTTAFLKHGPGGSAAPPAASDVPSGPAASPSEEGDEKDGKGDEDGAKDSEKEKGKKKETDKDQDGDGGSGGAGGAGGGQSAGSGNGSASGGGSSGGSSGNQEPGGSDGGARRAGPVRPGRAAPGVLRSRPPRTRIPRPRTAGCRSTSSVPGPSRPSTTSSSPTPWSSAGCHRGRARSPSSPTYRVRGTASTRRS